MPYRPLTVSRMDQDKRGSMWRDFSDFDSDLERLALTGYADALDSVVVVTARAACAVERP